jgi:hypothetical protein
MNKAQAEEVLKTLNERMQSCRLELHPEKTKLNKAYDWLKRVKEQFPTLFYQWRLGFS